MNVCVRGIRAKNAQGVRVLCAVLSDWPRRCSLFGGPCLRCAGVPTRYNRGCSRLPTPTSTLCRSGRPRKTSMHGSPPISPTSMAVRCAFQRPKEQGSSLPIYTPSEFFATKIGVCVDLSRFGVETLRRIDPKSDPKYLMIEFDPMQVAGNTLRLHWLASFRRDGKTYFFADSKRPGI